MKRVISLVLTVCMVISGLFTMGASNSYAKEDLTKYITFKISQSTLNAYVGKSYSSELGFSLGYWWPEYDFNQSDFDKLIEQIQAEIVWSTSDVETVGFVSNYDLNGNPSYTDKQYAKDGWTIPRFEARKEGKAIISAYSKTLKKTIKCTVEVRNARIVCQKMRFFTGKTYQFNLEGNAKAVSFSSAKSAIVSIDEKTGAAVAKKTGEVKLSCLADDGRTYTKTITIRKPKLSYTKITNYYFTGMTKGYYAHFPIVADGIDIKSVKSSNTKVVKASKKENICDLEIHGTGKATVTCTDMNGKKYTCKVTIVGGKVWSGLSGGYRPTKSEVKKHGYYKDINKIQDFGNVIFYIIDYGKEINYGNGYSKKTWREADEKATDILRQRYPGKEIKSLSGGDMLGFTDGKKYGRLCMGCYYVEQP